MVEKQNIGKEEERVIQRCTKIVRFPERVRVVCVCMYVCVCHVRSIRLPVVYSRGLVRQKHGSRVFFIVYTPRYQDPHTCILLILLIPIPFHLRDDLPFLLYLRVFIPSCLIRELDSNRLVTRAASVCIVP